MIRRGKMMSFRFTDEEIALYQPIVNAHWSKKWSIFIRLAIKEYAKQQSPKPIGPLPIERAACVIPKDEAPASSPATSAASDKTPAKRHTTPARPKRPSSARAGKKPQKVN